MKNYMVSIKLPEQFSTDFIELVAEQRIAVNNYVNHGIITSYITAQDSRQVWMEVAAINEGDVLDLLSTFPLIDFMKIEIAETIMPSFIAEPVSHISLSMERGIEKVIYEVSLAA